MLAKITVESHPFDLWIPMDLPWLHFILPFFITIKFNILFCHKNIQVTRVMKEALVIVEKLEKKVNSVILQSNQSTFFERCLFQFASNLGEVGPSGEKGSKGAPGMILTLFFVIYTKIWTNFLRDKDKIDLFGQITLYLWESLKLAKEICSALLNRF